MTDELKNLTVKDGRLGTPSPDDSQGPITPGTQLPPPLVAFGPLAGPLEGGAALSRHARHHRQSLSEARKIDLTLSLADGERERWVKSIEAANSEITSDATRLPKSTGRRGIPAPQPRPEELVTLGHWEEDETFENRKPVSMSGKVGKMLRSIPCLIVSDIQQSLPFYKEILGFVNVSKPDNTLASICRTPSGKPYVKGGEEGVHLYLRVPYGASGSGRAAPAMPPPQSLWIEVENVDDMFAEIYSKAQRTHPTEDDYFPAFPFGKARIDGRPTNTPFGTRECKIYDADANLLVFFQDLKTNARTGPTSSLNDNLVRGPAPVRRPANRKPRR